MLSTVLTILITCQYRVSKRSGQVKLVMPLISTCPPAPFCSQELEHEQWQNRGEVSIYLLFYFMPLPMINKSHGGAMSQRFFLLVTEMSLGHLAVIFCWGKSRANANCGAKFMTHSNDPYDTDAEYVFYLFFSMYIHTVYGVYMPGFCTFSLFYVSCLYLAFSKTRLSPVVNKAMFVTASVRL